jgi:hypothetical protein
VHTKYRQRRRFNGFFQLGESFAMCTGLWNLNPAAQFIQTRVIERGGLSHVMDMFFDGMEHNCVDVITQS